MSTLNVKQYCQLFMETAQTSVAKSALYMALLTLMLCTGALAIIDIFYDFQDGPEWMEEAPALAHFIILVILAPTLETGLLVTFVLILQKARIGALVIAGLFALVMAYLHFEYPVRGIVVTIPFFIWTYFYAIAHKKLPDRAWKIIFFAHAFHNAMILAIIIAISAFTQ